MRAYTLSTTDQDSQKAPTSIAFNIWTPPICLLAASQGFVDPSCLGLHLKGELWMRLESEHVTGRLQLYCLETCFWSIADTSRHEKLSPLPANFAELVPSVNTSTGSWRGSIAEAFFNFTACVREHVSLRISSDANHPNKHESSRRWAWRHCSINSMPSKRLIQEQALHQMYSFRPKVTFQWLLYWRSYS